MTEMIRALFNGEESPKSERSKNEKCPANEKERLTSYKSELLFPRILFFFLILLVSFCWADDENFINGHTYKLCVDDLTWEQLVQESDLAIKAGLIRKQVPSQYALFVGHTSRWDPIRPDLATGIYKMDGEDTIMLSCWAGRRSQIWNTRRPGTVGPSIAEQVSNVRSGVHWGPTGQVHQEVREGIHCIDVLVYGKEPKYAWLGFQDGKLVGTLTNSAATQKFFSADKPPAPPPSSQPVVTNFHLRLGLRLLKTITFFHAVLIFQKQLQPQIRIQRR